MGLDLNIQASNAISIFGGINFSGGNGKNSLSGGNIGVGFHSHTQKS